MRNRLLRSAIYSFGVILWLAAVVPAFIALESHRSTPGAGGRPSDRWPVDSGIVPDGRRPSLVLAAHPLCPCTRASIAELTRLLARHQGEVDAHILVFRPLAPKPSDSPDEDWIVSSVVPVAQAHVDLGGVEAARFGAATSGQILLYDSGGSLLYSGGITGSRGHEGSNPGLDALERLLAGRRDAPARMPVFGCALSSQANPTKRP